MDLAMTCYGKISFIVL